MKMDILEKIKRDQLASRIGRNSIKTALLTTVLSEAAAIGKNDGSRHTTDSEVVAYLKKTIKNLVDFHNLTPDAMHKAKLMIEINTLNEYLPQQMSEIQIEDIVSNLKTKGAGVPEIMKHFKEHHAGLYDGAFVSKLARG